MPGIVGFAGTWKRFLRTSSRSAKKFPNTYKESEYASCGITVINHIIAFDEFWWNGEDIGSTDANQVVYFFKQKGRVPESIKEAYTVTKFVYTDGGIII